MRLEGSPQGGWWHPPGGPACQHCWGHNPPSAPASRSSGGGSPHAHLLCHVHTHSIPSSLSISSIVVSHSSLFVCACMRAIIGYSPTHSFKLLQLFALLIHSCKMMRSHIARSQHLEKSFCHMTRPQAHSCRVHASPEGLRPRCSFGRWFACLMLCISAKSMGPGQRAEPNT